MAVQVLLPGLASLGVCYIFYALHMVTDLFFVPACTVCCDWLHIPDDVAGATLLGAGLNAPELFGHAVSLAMGNPVGLGLITGSFNFNILVIAGFTALFGSAGHVLQFEWRYVLRDVAFYIFALGLLQWSAADGIITFVELVTFLVCYVFYVCACVCTGAIARRCCSGDRRPRSRRSKRLNSKQWDMRWLGRAQRERVQAKQMATAMSHGDLEGARQPLVLGREASAGQDEDASEAGERGMTRVKSSLGRLSSSIASASSSIASALYALDDSVLGVPPGADSSAAEHKGLSRRRMDNHTVLSTGHHGNLDPLADNPGMLAEAAGKAMEQRSCQWPAPGSSWRTWAMFALHAPLHTVLAAVMPSAEANAHGWFPLSMVLSMAFLALLSYAMSQLSDYVAKQWHIPDELIGSTVVAMGTSLPNVVAAVAVGRRGKADMAVCQAFGSNTFDIFIAYALPLFIKSVALDGVSFQVEAPDLSFDVTVDIIFACLFIALSVLYGSRLLPSFGAICLCFYALWFVINLGVIFAAELRRLAQGAGI